MRQAARSRSDLAPRAHETLVWMHRWFGLVLCIPIALWILSGAVMIFKSFPSLSTADRLANAAVVDPASVHLSPAEVVSLSDGAEGLRLISYAGRPAYVVDPAAWPLMVFAADNGEALPPLSADQAKIIAEKFARRPAVLVDGPFGVDQWTVHKRYDILRPYYRVLMSGPDQTTLYVSMRTGEVVQRTTGSQRFWNGPGAILHWLYTPSLASNPPVWERVVGWLALFAALTVAAGLALGVSRLTNTAEPAADDPPRDPWLDRHYLLGLLAGVFVFGWLVTGWLSVEHGPFAPPRPVQTGARYTGLPISDAAARISLEELRRLGPSAQIEIGALGGQAFAVATGGGKPDARVVFAGSAGPPAARLPYPLISIALDSVLTSKSVPVQNLPADDFYISALSLPSTTVMAKTTDGTGRRIYVDSLNGRVLVVSNDAETFYAWLTYGLHGLRFPGLVEHPMLRAALLLAPLALGLILSLSGAFVAYRRLINGALAKSKKGRRRGVKTLQRSLDY